MLGGDPRPLEQVTIAAIGPITASAVRDEGLTPAIVATDYSIPGLVEAIVAHAGSAAPGR
jgi:uroporphyrinogen-III synthase